MSSYTVSKGVCPRDEANNIMATNAIVPSYCLLHNYIELKRELSHLVERSYERPYKWYFMVFKPFDKSYERDYDFYQSTASFDHIKKKLGAVSFYLFTREIFAAKTHVNVLVCSKRDLSSLHDKKTNKFWIFSKPAKERRDVFEYIIKESKIRRFKPKLDYRYYDAYVGSP